MKSGQEAEMGIIRKQMELKTLISNAYGGRYATIKDWLIGELGTMGRTPEDLARVAGVTVSQVKRWSRIAGLKRYAFRPAARAKIFIGHPCKKDLSHVIKGGTARYESTKRCVACNCVWHLHQEKEKRRKADA